MDKRFTQRTPATAVRIVVGSVFTALLVLSVSGGSFAEVKFPYCDEAKGGRGLCVSRDPIDMYLVVALIPSGRGWPKINVSFRSLSLSKCLAMPERVRCYRLGMYTMSQERLVREQGDRPVFGGSNSPTFREYYTSRRYRPKSKSAQTLGIEMQMSTGPEFLYTHAEIGDCYYASYRSLEGKGSGGRMVYADCAYLWIEPVIKEK